MFFTMPYSELYILIKQRANDVKFISVDRQKLDLSKYIYEGCPSKSWTLQIYQKPNVAE